jgi:glycosyltransferase involved in cell wall biosynthesis
VPFSGYASFEAIVDRFMGDEELRTALGHAGRAYVAANFNWPTLIERYVRFLERVK